METQPSSSSKTPGALERAGPETDAGNYLNGDDLSLRYHGYETLGEVF